MPKNLNADYVELVNADDGDPFAAIYEQQAAIVALLTEIRDDQRAMQGDTSQGRVIKTKAVSVSLL